MDRKSQHHPEIERLTRLSDSARACLKVEALELKHRLDVPERIRASLKSHPTGWVLGSLVSGLAASLLFRRKHEVRVEPEKPEKARSLPLSLLALTLTAVQPLAKVWVTDQVKNYLGNRLGAAHSRNRRPISPQ